MRLCRPGCLDTEPERMVMMATPDAMPSVRPEPMLRADGVSFGYGSLTIVDQVSIQVGLRETVVLLGPNGAGKSTLVKGLIGQLPLRSGSLTLGGADIGNVPPQQRVRLGVAYVPQIRDVWGPLTVAQNLEMGGYLLPRGEVRERADSVMTIFPALQALRKRRAGTLSGGERKMLAIGRALMTSPTMLILDEPTSNLAPAIARSVLEEVVNRLSEAGKAVLMVEQRVAMALEVATFGYVLAQGEVRLARDAAALRASEDELSELFFSGGATATIGAAQ
jgi:branched-chain amino acid transport system ATP-binding protein